MMLPKHEYTYINNNGNAQLIKHTTCDFTNVRLANNLTNLVVCPALISQIDDYYSMDESGELIKTVDNRYEYDYHNNLTYSNAYGCVNTRQRVFGFSNNQSVCEQEMNKRYRQQTFPNTWIINRPFMETVILNRNGEAVSTMTQYDYWTNNNYNI